MENAVSLLVRRESVKLRSLDPEGRWRDSVQHARIDLRCIAGAGMNVQTLSHAVLLSGTALQTRDVCLRFITHEQAST